MEARAHRDTAEADRVARPHALRHGDTRRGLPRAPCKPRPVLGLTPPTRRARCDDVQDDAHRSVRCASTSTDPCDDRIRCRRPRGHDGRWHRNGALYWDDDGRAYTYGDETAEGPFTPTMPDDELPDAIRADDRLGHAVALLEKCCRDVDRARAEGYAQATGDTAAWLEDGAWEALGGTDSEPPTSMYDRDGEVLRALADLVRSRSSG